MCRNYHDLLSESYGSAIVPGPSRSELGMARLNHDDAILFDSLKDRAVRERLAFDVPVPVYIDHPLSGLGRPDEHLDFERQLLGRKGLTGGWGR